MSWVKARVAQTVCAGRPAWLCLTQHWWGECLRGRMSLKDVLVCGASALLCLKCSWDILVNSTAMEACTQWVWLCESPACKGDGAACICQKLTWLLDICTLFFMLNNSGLKGFLKHTLVFGFFFEWGKTCFEVVGSLKHPQKISTLNTFKNTFHLNIFKKSTPYSPNFFHSKFFLMKEVLSPSFYFRNKWFQRWLQKSHPKPLLLLSRKLSQQISWNKKNHLIEKEQQKEVIHYQE